MTKRDPHVVLGIETGASPAQIKGAWRRLARQHHPDLTGDDPAASRVATRKMAEINDAYAALTRDGGTRRWGDARDGTGQSRAGESRQAGDGKARRGGPPRPRPTRPVTARVDMTHTVRPRNQPLRPPSTDGSDLRRHSAPTRTRPPLRVPPADREPPRASTPTGPLERSRIRNFRRPADPPLADALERELEFGKFRGHTLGQVAAFEPSYVDWLATTITRDRELLSAARVVRDDLDQRGVVRRLRPAPPTAGADGHRSA